MQGVAAAPLPATSTDEQGLLACCGPSTQEHAHQRVPNDASCPAAPHDNNIANKKHRQQHARHEFVPRAHAPKEDEVLLSGACRALRQRRAPAPERLLADRIAGRQPAAAPAPAGAAAPCPRALRPQAWRRRRAPPVEGCAGLLVWLPVVLRSIQGLLRFGRVGGAAGCSRAAWLQLPLPGLRVYTGAAPRRPAARQKSPEAARYEVRSVKKGAAGCLRPCSLPAPHPQPPTDHHCST
jgi:hypothetical protein